MTTRKCEFCEQRSVTPHNEPPRCEEHRYTQKTEDDDDAGNAIGILAEITAIEAMDSPPIDTGNADAPDPTPSEGDSNPFDGGGDSGGGGASSDF
jgi:hypothetical protein